VVVDVVVEVVVVVGAVVVVDLVLVPVLSVVVVLVGSEVVEIVVGWLVLEVPLPPLSLAITTTATIRPMMIASSAATR
jgi:hypothetical protein